MNEQHRYLGPKFAVGARRWLYGEICLRLLSPFLRGIKDRFVVVLTVLFCSHGC